VCEQLRRSSRIALGAMSFGSASSTPTGTAAIGCVMPTMPQPKARPQPKASPESIGPSSRANLVAEFQERAAAAKVAAAQAKPVVTQAMFDDEVAGRLGCGSGFEGAFNWSMCVCNKPEHDPSIIQKFRWSTVPNLPDPSCWEGEDRVAGGAATSTTSSVAASPAGPDSPMPVLATSHSTTKRPANSSGLQDERKRACRLF
jgi:hypothetical protein